MNKHQLKKQIDKEKYVRWQNYRITQLSFSINLFLTFGIAAICFCSKLLIDESYILPTTEKTHFFYALFWLCSSLVFGVLATITRLIDYRYTALKIREIYKGWRNTAVKFTTKHIGKLTWLFFGVQTGALLIGVYFLLVTMLIKHGNKFI